MVPRYLIECLPYFTVLNLGIKKSEFRRVNWLASVCMVPVSYTHLTLPTNREV